MSDFDRGAMWRSQLATEPALGTLTAYEIAALCAFRELWPAERVRKYYKHIHPRTWEGVLMLAWQNDWIEARGTLRALRNSPRFTDLQAIFRAFRKVAP